MRVSEKSVAALAESLGGRLKRARLNGNFTQAEVAELAGITRKAVLNAEKGKVRLEVFVAVMAALGLVGHLDRFLPEQAISPIQLANLQGKKRERASGHRLRVEEEGASEW